jgi:hypothetical protein
MAAVREFPFTNGNYERTRAVRPDRKPSSAQPEGEAFQP